MGVLKFRGEAPEEPRERCRPERDADSSYISRDSIKRLAAELADFDFIRIERSLLVNIRAVLYAETVGRGKFAFTLSCGACLHSSASYRDAILRALPLVSSSSRALE